MTRTSTRSLSALLGLALAFTSTAPITAQETQPAPSSAPQSATPTIEDKEDKKDQQEIKDAPPSLPLPQSAAAPVAKDKKGKQEYTGPNTVVELPPTPMLDEEGKQRQDPDGKLMFNPPIRQQRDKKGHPLFDEQGKPDRKSVV